MGNLAQQYIRIAIAGRHNSALCLHTPSWEDLKISHTPFRLHYKVTCTHCNYCNSSISACITAEGRLGQKSPPGSSVIAAVSQQRREAPQGLCQSPHIYQTLLNKPNVVLHVGTTRASGELSCFSLCSKDYAFLLKT